MRILGKAVAAATILLLAGPAASAAAVEQPKDDDGQNSVYQSRGPLVVNLVNYSNNDSIVETERVVNFATDRGKAATEEDDDS